MCNILVARRAYGDHEIGRTIELSHRLTPGQEEFPLEIQTFNTDEVMDRIERAADIWYILQEVKMGSHVGTHVEFPYHHLKDGKTAADYPLERLVGDAVVLDFSHKKKDEEITPAEVIDCGVEVRRGDIVFIRTDMDKLWKTPQAHDRPVLSIEATALPGGGGRHPLHRHRCHGPGGPRPGRPAGPRDPLHARRGDGGVAYAVWTS